MGVIIPIRQANKGTFTIIRTAHAYPTIAGGQAFRFKGDVGNGLTLLRRHMDGVNNPVNDDVDPIGVGGANVMAELLVARLWLLELLCTKGRPVAPGIRTSWGYATGKSDVL